jgi:SAM-dependent methyltransferase
MWDQRYRESGFAYGTEPNDFLAANAERHLAAGGDILSLAEGEGRNAVFLARLGFRVTGVDSSAVGLEKARKLAEQHGVVIRTVVADLDDFDLGVERWDGIVSIWCHTPSALRARLHRGVVAALRPGGVLLLEAYTPKQLEYKTGGPPTADLTMTLAAVREELAGLELLDPGADVRGPVRLQHRAAAPREVRRPRSAAGAGSIRSRRSSTSKRATVSWCSGELVQIGADNNATVRTFWEGAAASLGLDAGFVDEAAAHAGGNVQHAVQLRSTWLCSLPSSVAWKTSRAASLR